NHSFDNCRSGKEWPSKPLHSLSNLWEHCGRPLRGRRIWPHDRLQGGAKLRVNELHRVYRGCNELGLPHKRLGHERTGDGSCGHQPNSLADQFTSSCHLALTLALLIVAVPCCETDTSVNACLFSKRLLPAMRASFDLEANPPAERSEIQARHFPFAGRNRKHQGGPHASPLTLLPRSSRRRTPHLRAPERACRRKSHG